MQPSSMAVSIHLENSILAMSDSNGINGKPPSWEDGEDDWFSNKRTDESAGNYWE